MARCRFGDVVKEIKNSIDRENNPYDYYIAGGHMDSEELHIHRRGSFKTDDVGPAFIREFKKGQVLYGSRRTYLKKVAVADFDGVTANTTFVLETKDEDVLLQSILPFVMLSDSFTEWSIGKSKGSTNPYVLFSDLADYEFELPPLEKQRTLAKLLWEIDSTKCSYKDLIDKTDEVVKSQFIEMFGDPVINDRGWPTKSLKEVAPEYSPTLPEADLYWWLNLDMIETYSGRLLEKVMAASEEIGNSTSTFDESMVLYSKLRPYLNKVFVPDDRGYATTELVGMKPDSKILNKYFLFNLLRGDQFVAYANGLSSGGQMPRIPMKALRDFKCILPPIDLQEQFVETSKQSDKSKFELNEAIKDLDAMYKRIIKDNLG